MVGSCCKNKTKEETECHSTTCVAIVAECVDAATTATDVIEGAIE